MKKLSVLLQLYSVREDAEKDLAGTLLRVKEIGYEGVELAGLYGKPAADIKKMLDEAGLPAISAHVPYDLLMDDMEGTIAAYKQIGCRYIAVPYLTEEYRPPSEGFIEAVKNIGKIGACCKKNDIVLLYHNHDFEFVKMADGRYGLDYMYESISSEYLETQLDTCWVNVAGENPAAYIRKYAGRCPIVHLKDFYKEGNPKDFYELIGIESKATANTGRFEFRPLGLGMQVMPEIVEAAVESGASYMVVEQDLSVGRTSMEAAEISRKYLRLLGQ